MAVCPPNICSSHHTTWLLKKGCAGSWSVYVFSFSPYPFCGLTCFGGPTLYTSLIHTLGPDCTTSVFVALQSGSAQPSAPMMECQQLSIALTHSSIHQSV